MDHADAVLGFRRLRHGGIEQLEVLILGFGLSEAVAAALAIPTVGDGELRFGQVLALIVGVDQRVQRDPRDLVAAVLDVVDRVIEQNLVGLFGVLGDRVVVLLAAEAAGSGQAKGKQDDQGSAEKGFVENSC